MGLKTHGRRAYAAQIANDVRARRVSSPPRSTGAPTSSGSPEPVLSIANFRYRPAGRALSDDALDRAQPADHQPRSSAAGSFFLAPTILKGRTALRVSITNFRTREEDLLALLDESERHRPGDPPARLAAADSGASRLPGLHVALDLARVLLEVLGVDLEPVLAG